MGHRTVGMVVSLMGRGEPGDRCCWSRMRLVHDSHVEVVQAPWGLCLSLENPKSSGMWKHPSLVRLLSSLNQRVADLDMRQYGACYMKPTRRVCALPGLETLACARVYGHHNEHLQGKLHEVRAAVRDAVFEAETWALLFFEAKPLVNYSFNYTFCDHGTFDCQLSFADVDD